MSKKCAEMNLPLKRLTEEAMNGLIHYMCRET